MKLNLIILFIIFSPFWAFSQHNEISSGFRDASAYGFSPSASGTTNAKALQKALDAGGTIVVSKPGTYMIAATVYIGSYTSLVFGNGVFLKKSNEQGPFTHVILNKGALTKTFDEHISVTGLHIEVNGVDKVFSEVYGLRGQIAFFYVKDLKIEGFRCLDLGSMQFAIHICTFEDVYVNDVIIKGKKDGVHFGRGKRFRLSNGVFKTYDDAVALNAHDYATSNPEVGWIEDGIVENCHDLAAESTTGHFCRFVAGGWTEWKKGMEVRHSDAVVADGRLYRVFANPDGTRFISNTKPMHLTGQKVLDGINWGLVQEEKIYTAGVKNVVFRDIYLYKERIPFSIHMDNDKWNNSYYPGAPIPLHEQFTFENIKVLYDKALPLFNIDAPINLITLNNCSIQNNWIRFHAGSELPDYLPTYLNLVGTVFSKEGESVLVVNEAKGKQIILKTSGSVELGENFRAKVQDTVGKTRIDSDLTGLK